MTPQQFEVMLAQLKILTPSQLRSLQGRVNNELDESTNVTISDEEARMISSLFN